MDKEALSLKTKLLGGAGLGALGYAGIRGLLDATQTNRKQNNLIARRREDLSTPMYDPTIYVKRGYDEFSQQKLAVLDDSFWGRAGGEASEGLFQGINRGIGTGIGQALGQVLLHPLDKGWEAAKKHFVTAPQQEAAFTKAVTADPTLQQAHGHTPEMLPNLFATMKKFAPSVSTDPLAVRTFLTHGLSTGGALDFATLKLLAETERLHKARLGGQP
jgi:hypothetical protein